MIRHLPAAALAHDAPRLLWSAGRDGCAAAPASERPTPREEARAELAALLADELALAPERVRALCERELARFRGARELVLSVHPDDLALLPAREALVHSFELGQLALRPDATMARGGCTIVDAERGELDARVEARIERMLARLFGEGP